MATELSLKTGFGSQTAANASWQPEASLPVKPRLGWQLMQRGHISDMFGCDLLATARICSFVGNFGRVTGVCAVDDAVRDSLIRCWDDHTKLEERLAEIEAIVCASGQNLANTNGKISLANKGGAEQQICIRHNIVHELRCGPAFIDPPKLSSSDTLISFERPPETLSAASPTKLS